MNREDGTLHQTSVTSETETETETEAEIREDFLAEVLEGEEVGAEIVLDDPVQADYQIQRIARLRRKQEQITATVTRQMEQLQVYLEIHLTRFQKEIDWRAGPLEIYARDAHRRSKGKIKSLDLPHGKLKLRAQREKVECDEPKILAWCDDHAEEAQNFIDIIRRINKSNLQKYVKGTGEVPDGVAIVPPGEPNFHLEFKDFGEPPLTLISQKKLEE